MSSTAPEPKGLLGLDVEFEPPEEDLVKQAGLRSPAELLSVMTNFPSLATAGIDFPKLSNAAVQTESFASFSAKSQDMGVSEADRPRFGFGAAYPVGAPGQLGQSVPFAGSGTGAMPSAGGGSTGGGGGGGSSANLSGNPPLDFRLPNWPVRDQGDRGTCVAFATTACYEQFLGNAQLDLSEQFLYWAIKVPVGDGRPGQDGTWFDFARQALTSEGICAETLWPYSGVALPTNISRADANNPSQAAITDAATRLYGAALCQSNGNAATLYSTMQSRNRPVGISVPVFADPANQSNDNWNTTMGQVYGRIFDPPPTSVVVGGHAVCITGFEPDPLEQTGGWFIVRNSWGDQNWGASLPDPAHFGPEPGYGQISATYVDSFLWELFAM